MSVEARLTTDKSVNVKVFVENEDTGEITDDRTYPITPGGSFGIAGIGATSYPVTVSVFVGKERVLSSTLGVNEACA